MSLPDAARLVALRGRLMQSLPPGAMLSIQMSEQKLASILPSSLEIAAVNGPEFCVASGSIEAIESFAVELESGKHGDDIAIRRLRTSHAFHSRMMDPAIDPFEQVVKEIRLSAPEIPILSTVTSQILDEESAKSPAYWSRQIREPVRFSDSIAAILNQNDTGCILLEAGPNQALSTLARQQPLDAKRHFVVPSMPHAKQIGSDALFSMTALAQLWHCGANVNWNDLYRHEQRGRVHLPSYRFQRERYSFETEIQNAPNFNSEKHTLSAIATEDIVTPETARQDRLNIASESVHSGLNLSSLVQQQTELMNQQIALLRKLRTT
jgi:acyl transferase domain-containing protein